MHRKIKTWAYAILLLNIVVAGIGIAKLLFDVFTGNGNTQDGLLFQNLHLTAYSRIHSWTSLIAFSMEGSPIQQE